MSLLGRGGAALNEILSKGPQFLKAYEDELKSFGIILDEGQLKTGALTQAIDQRFHLALQGLEFQVGTQLEGAFSNLWQTLTKMAGGSDQLFKKIAQGVASVVGAIASLIQGLTGVTVDLKSLGEAANSPSAALDDVAAAAKSADDATGTLAGTAGAAKDSLAALRDSTRHETQALDDSRAAIEKVAKARLDARDDAITAARATQTALENQVRDTELLQQVQDDQHTSYLAGLQDELAFITGVGSEGRKSGESLASYRRTIREDELKDQISAEQNRRQTVKDTSALAIQKAKEATEAVIANLEAQKKAISDVLAHDVKAIEDRKTAITRYLQDMESKTTTVNNAIASSTSTTMSVVQSATKTAIDAVNAATGGFLGGLDLHFSQTFDTIGKTIRNWFQHPESLLPDAESFGKTLGQAIAKGLFDGVKDYATSNFDPTNPFNAVNLILPGSGGLLQKLTGHASGGEVLANAPYWVGERGPEPFFPSQGGRMLSHEDAMSAMASGSSGPAYRGTMQTAQGASGAGAITYNNYGPIATEFVADAVVRRLAAQARKSGLGSLATVG
jgi:hypothetical protein